MFNRRSFVQGGLCGLLGLGLPKYLAARRAQPKPGPERSVVFVFLKGGLSHLDSFDPKPDAAADFRGNFGSINTRVPGIRFSEHLPQLAQRAHRFALLRAVQHSQGVHEGAQRYLLSGDRVGTAQSPALGAVVARSAARRLPPPYVAVPAMEPNAGSLGPACEPYNLLADGGELLSAAPARQGPAAARAFAQRVSLLQDLDTRFRRERLQDRPVEVQAEAYRQAIELLGSDAVSRAIDLRREPEAVRARYGGTPCGDYLLLARRMVEAGSRFVTVVLDGWDTHANGFKTLRELLPPLDAALAALLDDLEVRGLWERTVVVALGEFGRTPLVNTQGGRDHWPRAMSVFWAGGAARGGAVVGATDATGAEPADGAVSPEDLAWTLLEQVGLDPAMLTVPPGGRKLITGGARIARLFG